MDFASPAGSVFMNVAMHYNRRRRADSAPTRSNYRKQQGEPNRARPFVYSVSST